MLDVLASEYGWTPSYVLDGLTRPQVHAMLRAIAQRYQRQADAVKHGGKPSPESADVDELARSGPEALAAWGIRVERDG